MKIPSRRNILGGGLVMAGAVAGTTATAQSGPTKRVLWANGKKPDTPPMISPAVSYGNLLFISGAGAHFEGEIKAHTKAVLDQIEQQLVSSGSSMAKVLKCNVYLTDMRNFDGMNEVYLGRFGAEPPVRTTVGVATLPGKNALIEIEVIAYI